MLTELMDYVKELAAEEQQRKGVVFNPANCLDRAGTLYICANKDTQKVTAVQMCDYGSPLKEDSFEYFIKCQVKDAKKLDYIPDESIFCFHIPDLGKAPKIYKGENNHFMSYIRDMQPQMRIELTDAVFAVKYGIDLIENGRCFSGFTGKVGRTERYLDFMEKNEANRCRFVTQYYLPQVATDVRKGKNPLYCNAYNCIEKMVRRLAHNIPAVDMVVDELLKREDILPVMTALMMPVLYNTDWGKRNISDSQMLNYLAKYEMQYLLLEFNNPAMLDFYSRNGLMDMVSEWDNRVKYMDDYVFHRGPGISELIPAVPGLTISETLYGYIQKQEQAIGCVCYRKLCAMLREQLKQNPSLDTTVMYPDFFRADCPGERPVPEGVNDLTFEAAPMLSKKPAPVSANKSCSWFHL